MESHEKSEEEIPLRLSQDSLYPTSHTRGETTSLPIWLLTMLPFFLHILLSVLIGAFVMMYVSDHPFNVSDRRPTYTDLDGSTHHLSDYRPLQTDITTALSISLALLRTLSGSWYAATCWRCAIILMELEGMTLANLKWMLTTTLPAMFRSRRRNGNTFIVLLVVIILLTALPAQYAAPILTGSISWDPGHYLVQANSSLAKITDSLAAARNHTATGYDPNTMTTAAAWSWYYYNIESVERSLVQTRAMTLGLIAWTSDPESFGLLKRPLVEVPALNTNITARNITMPFFDVESIEWVTNLNTSLSQSYIYAASKSDSGMLNVSSNMNPLHANGSQNTLSLLFDTPWENDGSHLIQTNVTTNSQGDTQWSPSIGIPDLSKFESTDGVMAIWAYHVPPGMTCEDKNIDSSYGGFGTLPENIAFASDAPFWTDCYVYAKIKYTAGVKTCWECEFNGGNFVVDHSDPSFASGSVLADPMVYQALRMLPETIQLMTAANMSLPTLWNNIEDYSVEMMRRAYCVSWTALNRWVGGDPKGPFLATPAEISVPSTIARVSVERVYAWFALQVLAMVSGLLFVVLQSIARKGLVRDTAMEMFMLDAREVKNKVDRIGFEDSTLRKRGLMRIEKGDSDDFTTVRYNENS